MTDSVIVRRKASQSGVSSAQSTKSKRHSFVFAYDELYENERRGILSDSFSSGDLQESDPPSWADSHGQAETKDGFVLADGWEWTSPWRIESAAGVTDDKGWQYAVTWHSHWFDQDKPRLFVRRRKWIRERSFNGDTLSQANASADLANVSEKAIQPEINHNDERKASAPNTPNNQVEKIPLSTVSPDVADIAIKEAPLHTESTKSVPEDAKSDVLTEQELQFLATKPHLEQQALLAEAIERKKSKTATRTAFSLFQKAKSASPAVAPTTNEAANDHKPLKTPRSPVDSDGIDTSPNDTASTRMDRLHSHPSVLPSRKSSDSSAIEQPKDISPTTSDYLTPPNKPMSKRVRSASTSEVYSPDAADGTRTKRAAEVKITIFQNERSSPFGNFSANWLIYALDKRTEWSFKDGSECPTPEQYELVPGWEWIDDWSYKKNTEKYDDEGWQYGFSFWESSAWYNKSQLKTFVRRRKWTRRRRMILKPGEEYPEPSHLALLPWERAVRDSKAKNKYAVRHAELTHGNGSIQWETMTITSLHTWLLAISLLLLFISIVFNIYLSIRYAAVERTYYDILPDHYVND